MTVPATSIHNPIYKGDMEMTERNYTQSRQVADIAGQTFGKLTVTGFAYTQKKQPRWRCKCECGNFKTVLASNLKTGNTKSCGCISEKSLRDRSVTHDMTYSDEYRIWRHIKSRCLNPNTGSYKNYGGRGISICSMWIDSFENFFEYMGKRPSSKHSIDRFPDKNGNYEPNNCRWATPKEQARNTRTNHNITYKGETHCLIRWAEILGMPYKALHLRIKTYNWSVERAFTTHIRQQRIK